MYNEMLSEYQTSTHFLNLGYRYAIQFPPCIMQRYINIFCERTIAGGIDSVHKINVIVWLYYIIKK